MSDKIEILSFDDWARFQGLPLDRDDDSHSYWSGYNQALRELFEILKGGVN